MVKNPILRGFHPDPSLIRVGDDYYLATSTFEWAPGVRIYHSKDLAHWEYLTAPLDTYSKMDLRGVKASDGIWAPCLSHDGEYFYLIYTVVHDAREFPVMDTPNYLIRAKEITELMKQRASYAIASMIPDEELTPENIIASPLNKGVADVVAKAVADTAIEEGIARI